MGSCRGGQVSVVLWSPRLWTEPCARLAVPHILRWDTKARVGWVGYFSPPRCMRFSLYPSRLGSGRIFPHSAGLVKKIGLECSGEFQNGSSPLPSYPPSCWKQRDFLQYSLWGPCSTPSVKLAKCGPLYWVPLGPRVFNIRVVHTKPPATCQLKFRFSYLMGFYLQGLLCELWLSVSTCLSPVLWAAASLCCWM